jgi:PAS domain S-box-containing protein
MHSTTTDDLNLTGVHRAVLAAACDNAFESIVITAANKTDNAYPIIYVNQAFTTMTGYGAEEVIGSSPGILQGPKTDDAVIERLDADLAECRPFHGQAINYRKDGSEFTLEWKVIPVTDGHGTVTHFVSVQREVN